jgi:hypothetical protein
MRDAEPCHFYTLPRELRNMVYHFLWKKTPLINEYYGHHVHAKEYHMPQHIYARVAEDVSVIYDRADEDDDCRQIYERLPRWLLVDKSFLAEGLAQLHLKAVWGIDLFDVPSIFNGQCLLNPSRAQSIRYLPTYATTSARAEDAFKELWNCAQLKRLEISLESWTLAANFYGRDDELRSLKINTDLFAALCEGPPNLQAVVIHIRQKALADDDHKEIKEHGVFSRAEDAMQKVLHPFTEKGWNMTTTVFLDSSSKTWARFDLRLK